MSTQKGFTIASEEAKPRFFQMLKNQHGKAYYRQGSYSDEIIWQNRRFIFTSAKKSIANNMWVFRAVMRDVKNFLNVSRISEKPILPVNYWNPKLKPNWRGKVTATDIDHAYWRIAFLMGALTPKLYEKGLLVKDKSIRLAALANLSSNKQYQVVVNGEVTSKTVTLTYDPIMHKVYNNIRYTCYEHMMNLAELLGNEFICYKTDCIYYKDKKKNRELVQVYLDSVDLYWKQLVEPPKPKKQEQSGTNPSAL